MTWKCIRLDLARTEDFPQGSAGRSYLLRLPLGEDGRIDEAALRGNPGHATVRRFWPSQPDMIGSVVRTASGWAFCYEPEEGERHFHFEAGPMRLGGEIVLTEPDGSPLPFRVASLRRLG